MADHIHAPGLFDSDAGSGQVECLGMTFESDEVRRAYFSEKLQEKLQDQAFRQIEGFPIGENEDILAMSDPPYYTACPNPFLEAFIQHYGTPYDPETDDYHREPYAADVSEGKTDGIFTAHSYHTKVPHKAAARYILHYTKPGDMVLDGFSGSGMTGVAAQMCAKPEPDFKYSVERERQAADLPTVQWGARRVVLNDLSPAATFISANYNLPFDVEAFEREARRILQELKQEIGWMYEKLNDEGKPQGQINYTVWSDIFSCHECTNEITFLEEALDKETKRVRELFPCPYCGVELTKARMDRLYETHFDPVIGRSIQIIKRRVVFINYTAGKTKLEAPPSKADLEVLQRVAELPLPPNVPIDEIPFMHMTHQRARMESFGITHIHHFFLHRAVQTLGQLWTKAKAIEDSRIRNILLFFVEQSFWTMSLLNRYRPTGYSQVNQYLTGVYYIASQHAESSPWYVLSGKLKRLSGAFNEFRAILNQAYISTSTAANLHLPNQSIDYIFTDPPFGENIYYADLNFLIESWHQVRTDAEPEAIVDKAKHKDLFAYQHLMRDCFKEYYRVLKPGRWMTVVFHNSQSAVWNAIQESMLAAKFVVAGVRTLDKQQGSYRQVTSTAVKQDLVITAYSGLQLGRVQ